MRLTYVVKWSFGKLMPPSTVHEVYGCSQRRMMRVIVLRYNKLQNLCNCNCCKKASQHYFDKMSRCCFKLENNEYIKYQIIFASQHFSANFEYFQKCILLYKIINLNQNIVQTRCSYIVNYA